MSVVGSHLETCHLVGHRPGQDGAGSQGLTELFTGGDEICFLGLKQGLGCFTSDTVVPLIEQVYVLLWGIVFFFKSLFISGMWSGLGPCRTNCMVYAYGPEGFHQLVWRPSIYTMQVLGQYAVN